MNFKCVQLLLLVEMDGKDTRRAENLLHLWSPSTYHGEILLFWTLVSCIVICIGWVSLQPLHSQDLIDNSPFSMPYNSHCGSLENLVLDQQIILFPNWYFSILSLLICLTWYWWCKEKLCLGHSWKLEG